MYQKGIINYWSLQQTDVQNDYRNHFMFSLMGTHNIFTEPIAFQNQMIIDPEASNLMLINCKLVSCMVLSITRLT